MGDIELELNSILVEKWKVKAYRLVIQRQKRVDGELALWKGEYSVFLLLTVLMRSFYKFIMGRLDVKKFGFKATSRIKAFVFRFIPVPSR